ncbi:hypothetical protein GW17_00026400 [Ensete ventricosum]|nr:hypothetical protein GW17_00026400 [Ensete ventricosum]RZR87120.1 hypothetical protein BHM03_00014449 [Ensete ventricosum]
MLVSARRRTWGRERVVGGEGSESATTCTPYTQNLEASTSKTSSGILSPVGTEALRDLEVMKVCHDFDSAMTEGSHAIIRECYNIPEEYRCMLHCPSNDLITQALRS